ncbi:MAG: hypothetical protein COB71_00150 [Thiotrichales bacterium]|nr:MAG: hypothetical protein COB71_00150 [Thiotrichales bacterium]
MNILNRLLLTLALLFSGQALAVEKITYFHSDILGSVAAATDQQGELLWETRYEPYGYETQTTSQPTAGELGYTGHLYEADTGLHYMQARYYDPRLGRFLSPDPIGYVSDTPQSFNYYAYANNNPYRYTDPTGLWIEDLFIGLPSLLVGITEMFKSLADGNFSDAGVYGAAAAADGLAIALPGIPGGASLGVKAVKASKSESDFFKGTKYTDKVRKQMQQGDFHSFPESVKAFQNTGKVSKLKGGDGVIRDKLEILGGYRGREGKFEFIKESNGNINHRLFKPNRE